jgi:hypothetical protein
MCKQGLNRIDAADSQQTKQSSIWKKQKRIKMFENENTKSSLLKSG